MIRVTVFVITRHIGVVFARHNHFVTGAYSPFPIKPEQEKGVMNLI